MNRRAVADLVFIIAILGFVSLVSFSLGQRFPKDPEIIERTDTVIVLKHDTTRIDTPVPVYREVIRTEYLSVIDTIVRNDTAFVPVPIERKVYEDSTYRAVVSGYKANLDSLWLFKTTKYITVTNTVKEKQSRWGFGAIFGPCVLITPKGSLYGGLGGAVGVEYRF